MRIVVAPDKFKGTLSASEAAAAMTAGALAAHPGADVVVARVADGGEGTLAALVAGGAGGTEYMVDVRSPSGERVRAPIAVLEDGRRVIEAATACGLGLLTEPDPMGATSAGVGDLIRHALDEDSSTEIVVGVGGTASTDVGTGAATALGWRFLDDRGQDLPPGGGALTRLHAIDGSEAVKDIAVTAACDVVNRLNGARGSARAFGPQKGASPEQVDVLARALERVAEIVRRDLAVDLEDLPFGGAGGGLGAGLAAFLGARLVSGFDLVAASTGLAARLARADIVLTGEGRVDSSTGEGKAVGGVVRLAKSASARCIVVAGEIDPAATLPDATWVSLADRFGAASRTDPARALTEVVAGLLEA